MKKLLIIVWLVLGGLVAMGQQHTINNLETGLSVRNKLNTMFGELYDNVVNLQFSADGVSWHTTYAATDNYMRISRDVGNTWGTAIPLTSGFKVQFSANDTIYSDSYTAGDAYYRFSTDGGTVWTDGIAMDASGFVEKADSVTGYVTHPQLTDSLAAIAAGNDNQTIDTIQIVNDTLQVSLERDAEPVKMLDLSQFVDVDTVYVERDLVFNFETLYYRKDGTAQTITRLRKQNGLHEGGEVSWIDSLRFGVSAADYTIAGEDYKTAYTSVTLDAADTANSRIDVIAVDTLNQVIILKGTAAASPQKPTINPVAHVELTQVLLLANATEPSTSDGDTLTVETVYDENTEWNGTASGVLADFAGTTNVYKGTYAAEVTTIGNGDYLKFSSTGTHITSDFTVLSMFVKLKAAMPADAGLYAQLQLTETSGSAEVELVIDKTITTWQNITLSMSEFSEMAFDELWLTWRQPGTVTFDGFYLDVVTFQNGLDQPESYQELYTDGTAGNVSITKGGTIDINVDDADADSTNEAITAIAYANDTLSITEAGSVHKVEIAAGSSSSVWTSDANGINYDSGNIGIDTTSHSTYDLHVKGSILSNNHIMVSGIPSYASGYFYNKSTTGSAYTVFAKNESTGSSTTIYGASLNGGSGSSAVKGINSSSAATDVYGGLFQANHGVGIWCAGAVYGGHFGATNGPSIRLEDGTAAFQTNFHSAPSSSTDTGTAGEVRFTTDYIYVCVATNTWKRVAISTW